MSPFRRSEPPRERSPEERERERAEREARRAARGGVPDGVPDAVPEPVVSPTPESVVPAPEPVVPAPEPVVPAPEPVAPAPEPVAPAPEPLPAVPEPVAPARELLPPAPVAPGERGPSSRRASIAEARDRLAARARARPVPRPGRRSTRAAGRARGGTGGGATAGPHRWRLGGQDRRRTRLLAIIPLALVLILAWFLVSLFQPFHGAGTGRVDVTIPAGSSVGKVGDILVADHVVSSSLFFSLRATLAGKRSELRAGHFVLARDMSYGAAIDALTKPAPLVKTVNVLIPEGRWRSEIARIAKADGLSGSYLAASVSSPALDPRRYGAPHGTRSLEGFLFPATYELRAAATTSQLVAEQLAAFKRNFAAVSLAYAGSKHLSAYDVLTVASMVESEAQTAKDRPLIAAVIYNRLHDRMPLGIDATTRYEFQERSGALTASQLAAASPYNTRRRLGLPPTPIGNPGLASIQAAAHPAQVPYLYFVVKPCGNGEHVFSTTYAQFQADAARYSAARLLKGGRSPTTC